MQKVVVKYLIIFFLLLVYINRGVFITPYELENNGNKEINSLIEWITQLIIGEENDIDEDGDLQNDYNSVNTLHHDYLQQFAQSLELANLFSKDIAENKFPNEENSLICDFYLQIDHPPQWI
ncbi:MAG: hypothetical protein FWC10_10760 [Lentimicrobiaceae bacterium]|nr:hypothetical protein [Lentimicrobiaceae bacterium]